MKRSRRNTKPITASKPTAHKPTRVRITFTTSGNVHRALKTLVGLGLYGANPAEAAERLVCEGIQAKKYRLDTINQEMK